MMKYDVEAVVKPCSAGVFFLFFPRLASVCRVCWIPVCKVSVGWNGQIQVWPRMLRKGNAGGSMAKVAESPYDSRL